MKKNEDVRVDEVSDVGEKVEREVREDLFVDEEVDYMMWKKIGRLIGKWVIF